MSTIHVHAPPCTGAFYKIHRCPTCERRRKFYGWHADWYGTTWTCLTCGDMWGDGERHERPFRRGWRADNIRHAREHAAKMGL